LALVVVLAFSPLLLAALVGWLGGNSACSALLPSAQRPPLSAAAEALLRRALAGIDPDRLADYHTHLAGMGQGSDCWVNPRLLSWRHPSSHVRFLFYLSAAGVRERETADVEFHERLRDLSRSQGFPQRHVLLAFDYRHDGGGMRDLEHSEFHVPNEHAFAVAQAAGDVFEPAISVHPYRLDALEQLDVWAGRGVRFVKWLPNAMGIDPADPRNAEYYAKLVEHEMVLIVHVGEEQAVEAEADQALGNPLRLRRPLDAGVRVIAAHCASSGEGEDLDHPGQTARNFDLFLRLLDEPRYEGLLFGDISTVTQFNRFEEALTGLLGRPDLHERLVNGSDWPLPAINVLYQLGGLVDAGFLDRADRAALRELYDFNPLTFDFVLKRTVAHPQTGARFAPSVFQERLGLELRRD